MKLETLCKRLAEKTACPELEEVLLRGGDLPSRCLVWSGAVQHGGGKPELRLRRDRANLPGVGMVVPTPLPVIQYEGRRVSVRALIYRLIHSHGPEPLLRRLEGCHKLCVHPDHCRVYLPRIEAPEEPEIPVLSDDWAPEEVLELVEILLTEQQPQCWDDVVSAPLLEGAPEDLLRQVLVDLGKEHLT